jgi:hypothetical protein
VHGGIPLSGGTARAAFGRRTLRTLVTTIAMLAAPVAGLANGSRLPPMPDWQTDAARCAWEWREGGGIGLWTQTCAFNGEL